MKRISVLISDLDNTLWDWLHVWFESYSAMLDRVARISGVPLERLLPEVRDVQRRHGTSEYAFLIQELPILQDLHKGEDLVQIYAPAIAAFRKARRQHLHLYEGVSDTLDVLSAAGCTLAGYTESREFYTDDRLRSTGLDRILDIVYYPRDHALPAGKDRQALRRYAPSHYALRRTRTRYVPIGVHKPAPEVLLSILKEIGVSPSEAVYVGDNLRRDVAMAQDAGVTDVFAAYGSPDRASPAYRFLERLSYLSDSDIEAERKSQSHVIPTYRLEKHFGEILDLFEFGV